MNCLLKFSAINLYFINNHSLLERGENSYMSKNVLRVDFDPQLLIIRGKVSASMKARTYDVEVHLANDFNVEKATCKCPRGLEICHHIAAAMFAARYEISKTDVPCSWVPTPDKSDTTKSWKELYNIPKPKRVSQRDLTEEEISEFGKQLRNELCCGFGWILKDEPEESETVDIDLVDVNAILSSDDFLNAQNQTDWLREKMKVTEDSIRLIAASTTDQRLSVNWHHARRLRITASNFGVLISSIQRSRFPKSLFDRLIGQKNLDGVKSIEWGKTHENDGIRVLENHLGIVVQKTGLWLSPSGMLGASPDGIVSDYIVEIKCRYKSRSSLLSEDLEEDKSYVIWFNKASQVWVVNKDHDYYHQVQGQMHLANKSLCYLVVWTPLETAVVVIEKSSSWAQWLTAMENFYVQTFIPFVQKSNLNKI